MFSGQVAMPAWQLSADRGISVGSVVSWMRDGGAILIGQQSDNSPASARGEVPIRCGSGARRVFPVGRVAHFLEGDGFPTACVDRGAADRVVAGAAVSRVGDTW